MKAHHIFLAVCITIVLLLSYRQCKAQKPFLVDTTAVYGKAPLDTLISRENNTLRQMMKLVRYWNFKNYKDKRKFDSLLNTLPYRFNYKLKPRQ